MRIRIYVYAWGHELNRGTTQSYLVSRRRELEFHLHSPSIPPRSPPVSPVKPLRRDSSLSGRVTQHCYPLPPPRQKALDKTKSSAHQNTGMLWLVDADTSLIPSAGATSLSARKMQVLNVCVREKAMSRVNTFAWC